jgi:hypothetical protein
LPSGTVSQHEEQPRNEVNRGKRRLSLDADKILAEFSAYANTENDSDRLKHRYEDTWKLLNGFAEHQSKCKDVTGIRLKELKQAA